MYVRVKLLNGFKESLTYSVPSTWKANTLPGSIIEVPLQKRTEAAFVEEVFHVLTEPGSYTIREALSCTIVPTDPHYTAFIEKMSAYYALDKMHFFRRIRHFLDEKQSQQLTPENPFESIFETTILTDEQEAIVSNITPSIEKGDYFPALIHGVTGSGKTEIYKKLIMHAWNCKKSSLLLLPEVTLAVQFTHILKKQLPSSVTVGSFHSATSIKEKKELWQKLLHNEPVVLIGVHIPIMLPIPHLGLILIDEEHDTGFQEKKHPRIHTKDAAFLRAHISSVPIIAGSATPSISSLYNVKHKGWHYFELKKRFAGEFPTISVVKLTDKKPRPHFWISKELERALAKQLEKKEQTIIFLNRRGYSFFIQCKDCGIIPHCKNCSVSLTVHNQERLLCHYCSYEEQVPLSCSSCQAPSSSLIKKGIGTQQVVSVLEKMFPQARIARADLDSTINKKKWMQTLTDFQEGSIDILIGTQTITKGYHFPRVTLVGILWADINLSMPVYNASEVTLQQLIQVAGRAGRQSAHSHVIVQTMIDHPIYQYLSEKDYAAFYASEIQKREEVSYPPCVRFAEIELKNEDEATVIDDAKNVVRNLHSLISKKFPQVSLLGPSAPPVHTIKNVTSRKLYLKSTSLTDLITLYKSIDKKKYKSAFFFTPNPLS